MACVLAGAAILSSCVQIEEEFSNEGKTPLEAPVVSAGEVTTSSISFSWNAVTNASQYYYKVVNPAGYTVAKGLTRETSATVKGIKFSTTFTVYVNSVPAADVAGTYCSSAQTEILIKTDDPIVIDYEWVHEGTAYFYGDANYNEHKITFGREKGTGHFIITSWIGSDGFDLYFDITDFDGSSYPINFDYGTPVFQPVIGQAIDQVGPQGDRGDLNLSHGLGGKAYDYVYWYGKGASYDYGTIDPSGGFIDFWCLDYDGTWCGYHVEYGAYEPEPEPEPVPDPDDEESWNATGTVSFNDIGIADIAVSFDASTGAYTLSGWYGVEDYDVVFTRDDTSGNWIISPESSAYAGEDTDSNVIGLYHGLGRKMTSICWLDTTAWASGLSGNSSKGYLFASMTGPDGEKGTYKVTWDNQSSNNPWMAVGTAYYGDAESGDLTPITTTKISFDPATGKYVIKAFYGVEGYDLVFSMVDGVFTLDPQYSDGAVPVGFKGASYDVCYFYDYNTLNGTSKKGNVEMWMYNPDGTWCGYYFYWDNTPDPNKEWYATGTSFFGDNHSMETITTMKYNPADKTYTVYNWWGVEGFDVVFKVAETGEILPLDTLYEVNGEEVKVPHGLEGAAYDYCSFYTTYGYSGFYPDEKYGFAWIYSPDRVWDYWQFEW